MIWTGLAIRLALTVLTILMPPIAYEFALLSSGLTTAWMGYCGV